MIDTKAISILYRGHIDCLGAPFGAVIYDILLPPWKNIYDIPESLVALSVYDDFRKWKKEHEHEKAERGS